MMKKQIPSTPLKKSKIRILMMKNQMKETNKETKKGLNRFHKPRRKSIDRLHKPIENDEEKDEHLLRNQKRNPNQMKEEEDKRVSSSHSTNPRKFKLKVKGRVVEWSGRAGKKEYGVEAKMTLQVRHGHRLLDNWQLGTSAF
ncbi:hypothetical protein L6452_08776 [Arctium lappa]|uniref:Uncharacterized protein n=1 Tax=Arctium lappa TaxID=4217 RepID=A0ACB9DIP8_ARCLA|nr:hypothetical protein L6452_08776 [Arctium lappa]